MKWVHRHCLDRWRVDSANPRNFTHCRHCGFAFQLVLQRPPTEGQQQLNERRRRFMRSTISHFIMTVVLVQTALIALAMLIRAIDGQERLVVFFGLPQVEGTPPAGEGDYWNAIRHHKSTYYLSSVLVSLFVVGVIGTFHFCSTCCAASRGPSCDCDPCPHVDPLTSYYCGETCGDCCYFCGRCCEGTECPQCECPTAPAGQCDDCQCGDCRELAAVLAVIAIVVVVALIFVGLIMVMVAITAWLQKSVARYFQLKELRQLTGEYVVQDLSLQQISPQQAERDMEAGPAQMGMPEPTPSAPPVSFGPVTAQTVQMSLTRDLQAVYGYGM